MRHTLYYSLLSVNLLCGANIQAQEMKLTLGETIDRASESSLSAIKAHRSYLSGYWEYRSFKAERLPSLTLDLTPAQYNHRIIERYDSYLDRDVYRSQRSYYASGGLSIEQNVDWTGGKLYVEADIDYLRYFGASTYTQFTSVPFRIGYSQSLVGYNAFKWDKRIEPIKYQKKQKELTYDMVRVSEEAIGYFFALAQAQAEHELARKNLASCDTLYSIGREREKIAAISKADLLTLQLDVVNARNTMVNSEMTLKRAMFQLASFLNLDKETPLKISLPERPVAVIIPIEKALEQTRANNPEIIALKQSILESRRSVDRTRKESYFNMSLNASVGFNQVSDQFKEVWKDLRQQDMVALSISIPIIDWGVRKGKYNMAKNNLSVVETSAQQSQQAIEEEVIMTVNDFNIQSDVIQSAEEACGLAESAYEDTRMRFIIGKSDINSLSLALSRKDAAQKNYISALRNYWLSYYKIKRLTLYDFELDQPIETSHSH